MRFAKEGGQHEGSNRWSNVPFHARCWNFVLPRLGSGRSILFRWEQVVRLVQKLEKLRWWLPQRQERAMWAYITGVLDTLHDRTFCLPQPAWAAQAIDVVIFYLHDHPERHHLPASGLVVDALTEKFPCSGQ